MAKRKTRRGHGEGSLYQRADGYWVGAVEAGRCRGGHRKRDGTICKGGERRRIHVVARTKTAVLRQYPNLKERAGEGTHGGDSTVEKYARYFLDEVKAGTVAASTLETYTGRFDNWIIPHLGPVKLRVLAASGGVEKIQSWLNTLTAEGLSPASVSDARTALSMMLRYAVGARIITWNPAEYVVNPKAGDSLDEAFTPEEAEAVLAAANGDRLQALYEMAIKYGMREGELLALPDDRVDLDKGLLKVGKAKSRSGVRDLPLLAGVNEALRRHRERRDVEKAIAGPAWQDHGLFFCEPDGTPIRDRYLRRRWTTLLNKAGIEHRCRNCDNPDKACSSSPRRFHASRHTAATLLLEAGVELEVVSAILGHSGIKITADLYAKVRADLKRRGLLKLDDVGG